MTDYLKELAKISGNEYANLVDDGIHGGDVSKFVDTGSYVFNALLSGSIYGGLPANKITALAGESATGKTYFTLGIVKHFLDTDPRAGVIYFESESALTKDMLASRGIDIRRVVHQPVATVEDFRFQAMKILERHEKYPPKDRPPLMMCLDSLGMLSTVKEVTDMSDGKTTRDMTRSQVIKGAFRVLTLMLGKMDVPMIITNHTYDSVSSLYPQKVMSGGSGIAYAASSIIFLSKRKEKDGTEIIGNIIHCKNFKSRLTKENKMVDVLLTYDKGLSKWYGMLELAEASGAFEKVSTRYQLPDGSKIFGKQILAEPEKYFTADVMKQIDDYAMSHFSYGRPEEPELEWSIGSKKESIEVNTEGEPNE